MTLTPLLRLHEVARILDVSKRQVDRFVASGELPSIKLGNSPTSPRRVQQEALRLFIERHHQ